MAETAHEILSGESDAREMFDAALSDLYPRRETASEIFGSVSIDDAPVAPPPPTAAQILSDEFDISDEPTMRAVSEPSAAELLGQEVEIDDAPLFPPAVEPTAAEIFHEVAVVDDDNDEPPAVESIPVDVREAPSTAAEIFEVAAADAAPPPAQPREILERVTAQVDGEVPDDIAFAAALRLVDDDAHTAPEPTAAEILGDEPSDEGPPVEVALDIARDWQAIVVDDGPPADALFDAALALAAEGAREDIRVIGEQRLDDHAPEFQRYVEERVAADRPTVVPRDVRTPEMREFSIDFGPAWAPAGAQVTITARPQVLFRGEKIIATDTFDDPGTGTRVVQVAVGQKIQKPGNGGAGTLTKFFAVEALGDGVRFDTAQDYATISVTVNFIQSCTFDMTVLGRAVVD